MKHSMYFSSTLVKYTFKISMRFERNSVVFGHLKISVAERYLDTIGMTEQTRGLRLSIGMFVGTRPKFLQSRAEKTPFFPPGSPFFSASRHRKWHCTRPRLPKSAAARNDDGFFDPPSRRLHAA